MEAIAVFGFFSNNIENRINKFCPFCIMSFRPVIAGTRLSKHKVIRAEDLTVGTRSDAVHGTWFKVHEDCAWNKPPTTGFVVVDINPLELKILITAVTSGGVDAMLSADYFPELGSDLVAALSALNMEDFSHDFVGDLDGEKASEYLLCVCVCFQEN